MNTDPIVKINKDDEAPKIIETINNNFRTLTQCIKDLNINLSYLDILHITKVYPVKQNEDKDTALRNFVTGCWNLLANYAGAFITSLNTGELFKWQDTESIHTGAMIIKLPGNQSIVIPGNEPQYYYPKTYTPNSGTIEYELTSTNSDSSSITVPTILNAPSCVTAFSLTGGSGTVSQARSLVHVEFQLSSGEPVYITYTATSAGSTYTITPATNNLTGLTAIVTYIPTNN